MLVLVLNAGSSSLKFGVFSAGDDTREVFKGSYERFQNGSCEYRFRHGETDERGAAAFASPSDALKGVPDALKRFDLDSIDAIGHRIVHGGTRYSRPVELDAEVIAELERLVPLAPLHQPHHLEAIAALSKLHPDLMQIGCFDTAFHETRPAVAKQFALPRRLTEEGILRYGFHGLSYEYISNILPDVAGPAVARGRVVVAHLGAGASLCAMKDGKSVATTMGFTALDGLMMSRRCGALDPGVVLYLLQEKGMTAPAVSELLYRSSGLLGVSGISDDMKILLASPEPHAREATDQFVYRFKKP